MAARMMLTLLVAERYDGTFASFYRRVTDQNVPSYLAGRAATTPVGGHVLRCALVTKVIRAMRDHPSAVLLLGQVVAILAYPFLDGSTAGRAGLGVLQLLLLLAAVAAVRLTPAFSWAACIFGGPAMIFAVWESVAPNEGWVVLASAFFHVPFYLFVSYAMIRYLFHDDVVTRDELFATGAAFTVVAWAFAYLYAAVQVIWPGSFGEPRQWFDLLYLSFTTLTSVGLSDIVPVLPNARAFVMIEQIAGVFYVAMVVARLVGLAAARARRV